MRRDPDPDEIYGLADDALAHLHAVERDPESVARHGPAIERKLERIRRRTDPAIERDSNE